MRGTARSHQGPGNVRMMMMHSVLAATCVSETGRVKTGDGCWDGKHFALEFPIWISVLIRPPPSVSMDILFLLTGCSCCRGDSSDLHGMVSWLASGQLACFETACNTERMLAHLSSSLWDPNSGGWAFEYACSGLLFNHLVNNHSEE